MDWNAIAPHLDAKLNPAHVKPPSKFGPKGDYIEGWLAIAEANRIFGHGGWSYIVRKCKCVSEAPREIGQYKKPGFGVTYTAEVMVYVGDGDNVVQRADVGAGHGYDVDLGLAHESAIKEAVTDALKRALRTFGNPFGLALYDKSKSNVGEGPSVEAQRAAFRASLEPPHDPQTGEVLPRNNPAQAASDGLRDAWIDGIKDSLGFNCSDMTKLHPAQRLQFWAAVANALIDAFKKKKTPEGVDAQWHKRIDLLEEMQQVAPAHYERAYEAYSARKRELDPHPPIGLAGIAGEMADGGTWGG